MLTVRFAPATATDATAAANATCPTFSTAESTEPESAPAE